MKFRFDFDIGAVSVAHVSPSRCSFQFKSTERISKVLRTASTVTETKERPQCISHARQTQAFGRGSRGQWGGSGNETRDVEKEDPDPDLMRRPVAEKAGAAARTGLVRRGAGR